jgi:hypothetical protein
MATFDMHILATRDSKGKFKEFEAGREFLLKSANVADEE